MTTTARWARPGSVSAVAVVLLVSAGTSRAQVAIPRDVEMELARSTLPAHLREEATVYVYEPGRGLVVTEHGSNGFHAFVSRVEPALFRSDLPYTEHPDDVLLPISFDRAGVDGPMVPFLEANALLAEGTGPEEMKAIMRERFDSGRYEPASRAGVAYMLAPVMRAYPDPLSSDRLLTLNVPHRMFYAPFVSNEDIGGRPGVGTQAFIIQEGVHGYIGQRAGPMEVARINEEYSGLIDRLCGLDARWCLPGG